MIVATVEIEAPPERVYRALASEEIVRWWGSDELYRIQTWEGVATTVHSGNFTPTQRRSRTRL